MLFSVPYMITSFNPMTLAQVLLLVGGGISAAGGQFAITAAYYHAPARDISIYDYTQLIFSTLFGIIFFGATKGSPLNIDYIFYFLWPDCRPLQHHRLCNHRFYGCIKLCLD